MARNIRLIERGETPADTREVPITGPEFVIGRAADADLRLRHSEISRHHCIIRTSADEVLLVDLGSRNGTYLNGQRVLSQAALHSGDEIVVAGICFIVDLGDEAAVNLGIADVDPVAVTVKVPKKTNP
jgi:pSer/pThr/pTyr-binding forkhead associated (FHA) protein